MGFCDGDVGGEVRFWKANSNLHKTWALATGFGRLASHSLRFLGVKLTIFATRRALATRTSYIIQQAIPL